MNILFIGQCNYGSTSRMRFEHIKKYFGADASVFLIDTSELINNIPRIFRSVGWRFKIGPLVKKINNVICSIIKSNKLKFDLIWVEKGVFIYPSTVSYLKSSTYVLVHFTPDPAFLYHNSRFFNKSISNYDHCITTKSFELQEYRNLNCKNIILCTQGFDEQIHKTYYNFDEKIYDVCFIGHHEKNRERILQSLIDNNITILLAGIKWKKFVFKNRRNKKLNYLGNSVVGDNYAKALSSSKISLGLLSKWIPEKHTTRTFEIPACGTALLTEYNEETASFFNTNEVLFYTNEKQILGIIQNKLKNSNSLKDISIYGQKKVLNGNYSHAKIMNSLLDQVLKK